MATFMFSHIYLFMKIIGIAIQNDIWMKYIQWLLTILLKVKIVSDILDPVLTLRNFHGDIKQRIS